MAEKKKILSSMYNVTLLGVVFVAVLLINIISSFVYQRYDMTEDQRYSLADGTIDYLKSTDNFKGRLNLKIYLAGNLPAEIDHFRNAIEDKLKEFKQYAGDRIEYQFIDPNVGTEAEQDELKQTIFDKGKGILPMRLHYSHEGSISQLDLFPGAILEYGGATKNTLQFLPGTVGKNPLELRDLENSNTIQNAINNLEYILISGIRRATQEKKPRIAFLGGHGELAYKETQRVRSLISPYFSITDITLNDSIHALDDVDGLVIARPKYKFSDKDLYIIDQFVMDGGRLMCFLDQLYVAEDTLNKYGQTNSVRYETGLDRMLFDYGLKINDNFVIDAQCATKPLPMARQAALPWFYHVLATPTSHPISRNVDPVSMEYTSEIQFVGEQKEVALTPVLTSSTNSSVTGLAPMVSLAMPINYGKNPELAPNPTSETNKKCVAGLAEGMFTSFFKNRIVAEFANNPDVGYLKKSSKEGKIFLAGNGRMIANDYDSTLNKLGTDYLYRPKQFNNLTYDEGMSILRMPHYFGNQDFFQNLTDYMMGDNSVLDIRSRQIDIREINNEKVKADSGFYKLINIALPIGLIMLLAFVMNRVRKRRFAQ